MGRETLDQIGQTLEAWMPYFYQWRPVLLVLAGFVIGFIIEKLIFRRFKKRGTFTGWKADRVVVAALQGIPIFWGTLAGIAGAIIYAPLSEAEEHFWLQALLVPLILSIIVMVIRLGSNLLDYFNELRGGTVARVSLFRSLIKATILVFGMLVLLQSLGISITPFLATLGISGLAISLALEETLSNVFSGLYIIMSKQTRPGDYVFMKIDERDHIEGYIVDITWRSTKIRMTPTRMTSDGEPSTVIVPNSRMASDIVIMHHHKRKEREMVLDIRITAGGDLDHIERITTETATRAMQQVLGHKPETEPVIRYRTLAPTYIDLTVVMYGPQLIDAHLIQHETLKQLYQRYQREGINIVASQTGGGSGAPTPTVSHRP
jgi:small-conductance mechanosensitive channel